MEHHDVLKMLQRLRYEKQALADKLHDQRDYSAEFPASEVEALDYALLHLSLEGPLTFSARYYKARYEELREPTHEMVLRALLAANPGITVYRETEYNQMRDALKAGWGLPAA